MGTATKIVLIVCGVLAAMVILGGCAVGLLFGAAMNATQNMGSGSYPGWSSSERTPSTDGSAPVDTTGPVVGVGLDVRGDQVCAANTRLAAGLLEHGRLLHTGAAEAEVTAHGARVLAIALETQAAAGSLADAAVGGDVAALYAVRNSARMLAALTEAAVTVPIGSNAAGALSTTHDAWEASTEFDRDLRRALFDNGYDAGTSSPTDACTDPLDWLDWPRMIDAPSPS